MGTRRWQYDDGRFNDAGYERYFGKRGITRPATDTKSLKREYKAAKKSYGKAYRALSVARLGSDEQYNKRLSEAKDSETKYRDAFKKYNSEKYAKQVTLYKERMRQKYADDPKKLSEFENLSDDEILNSVIAQERLKKAAIAGGVLVGTAVAAYATYKLYELNGVRTGKLDPVTKLPLLAKDEYGEWSLLSAVNPYGPNTFDTTTNAAIMAGSQSNCMLCTTSYDLMKRGYDVRAGMSLTGWMPDDLFPKIYKNYEGTIKLKGSNFLERVMAQREMGMADQADSTVMYQTVVDQLKKISNPGANGNIVVWWKSDGGHSMIWENVNGKIIFKDAQTNTVYNDFENQILKHVSWSKGVELLRTDNLEINPAGVKKYMLSSNYESTFYKAKGTYQAVSQAGKVYAKAFAKTYPQLSVAAVSATTAFGTAALADGAIREQGVNRLEYRRN